MGFVVECLLHMQKVLGSVSVLEKGERREGRNHGASLRDRILLAK